MKLLIVEDEQRLCETIGKYFNDQGYTTDLCFDGSEALHYIGGTEYDAIILDVMLPGMDGISLLKRIRGKKMTTPVLLLTAKNSIEDKVDGSIEGSIHKLSQYKLSQDKPSQVYLTSAKIPLPPTYDMVLAYARTRGREDIAKKFYDINSANEWCDPQGNPISSWKRWFDGYAEKHPMKARYGNFDVNEAFKQAVKRSMNEEEN